MKQQQQKDYTQESLLKEREYGLFWYSWLWTVLRPLLIALCVFLVVAGVAMAAWNWVNREFFAPVDAKNPEEITFVVSPAAASPGWPTIWRTPG